MLVVVVAVDRVQVLAVTEVGVAGVDGRLVSAVPAVDVHVAAVREVLRRGRRGPIVDMIAVRVMEVAVVQVVEVVVVLDLRVPAPEVVSMQVGAMRDVRLVLGRPSDIPGHDGHGGTARRRAHPGVIAAPAHPTHDPEGSGATCYAPLPAMGSAVPNRPVHGG